MVAVVAVVVAVVAVPEQPAEAEGVVRAVGSLHTQQPQGRMRHKEPELPDSAKLMS